MWATAEDELTVDAPCIWPVVFAEECTALADLDANVQTAITQFGIEVLHAASGRQFGECVVTYQPCRRECAQLVEPLNMWQTLGIRGVALSMASPWDDSYYATMVCANCGNDDCGCVNLVDMLLWHRRVNSIVNVTVDGVELDPANYRLWRNRLIRLDGEAWPDCQDGTVPLGSADTWSVSYRHGRPVPYGGQVAAGILICELAKLFSGNSCALPKRVQSITRQGVSVAFLDPMAFLEDGKTGVYAIDLWLSQVNPSKLKRRARVFSADAPRRNATRDRSFDPFPGS